MASSARDVPGPDGGQLRALELVGLFVVLPLGVAFFLPRWGLPVLLGVSGVCFLAIRRGSAFDRSVLVRWPSRDEITRLVVRALAVALLLVGLTALFAPRSLFELPRHRPLLWLAVVVLYPILSVPPQEFLFRVFFLQRYARILPDARILVGLNAAVFGLAHLVLWNPLAVGLSSVGGLLFARTYLRTRSFPAVCLEHALYGVALFTLGLGRFFVTGWMRPP